MTADLIRLAAAESGQGVDLPAEPWAIGVGAFVGLVLLLLVTLTFGKDR